jgi:hypothetical protein
MTLGNLLLTKIILAGDSTWIERTKDDSVESIHQSKKTSKSRNTTLVCQNIENCYDQVFNCAKQAEKDEAEAMKIIPPSQ